MEQAGRLQVQPMLMSLVLLSCVCHQPHRFACSTSLHSAQCRGRRSFIPLSAEEALVLAQSLVLVHTRGIEMLGGATNQFSSPRHAATSCRAREAHPSAGCLNPRVHGVAKEEAVSGRPRVATNHFVSCCRSSHRGSGNRLLQQIRTGPIFCHEV